MGSRPVHRTDDIKTEIDKHLPDLYHHREDAKDYKEQADTEQAELLALFKRLGIQSHATHVDGGVITGTWSQSHSSTLDEDMLKVRIGAAAFNKLTKRVVDKRLLADAIATGNVDPAIVSACTRTNDNNPYIKTLFNAKAAKTGASDSEGRSDG